MSDPTKYHHLSISVITPSLNQATFLGRCLDSVAVQTTRPIEHLVLDPGSTDGSRAIAAAQPGVTLLDEPDKGQADAVGRGIERAAGDVIAWLNSDDEYHDPHVFASVLDRFAAGDEPDVVYGRGVWIDAEGNETGQVWVNTDPARLLASFHESVGIAQPAVFLRRRALARIGLPDKRLHFALDYDYWIRAAKAGLHFAFLDRTLARLRYYPTNKTAGQRGASYREICQVVKRHFGYVPASWLQKYANYNLAGADGISAFGSGDASPAEIDREIGRLATRYNFDQRAIDTLERSGDAEPLARNRRFFRRYRETASPPWKEIPFDQRRLVGHRCYTVGPRRFAFDERWLRRQLDRTNGGLQYFRSHRRSDTCIIAGNGPSLNQVDMSLLGGLDLFASNYAFLHDGLRPHIRFLSVVNYTVAEQGAADFQEFDRPALFVPLWLRYCISDNDHVWFVQSVGHPEFSTDIEQNVSWRSTVSFFNLQLAFGLGYRKVLLIGFDHAYAQDPALREGDLVDQRTADTNHFDPYYFYDKTWQAADTGQMEAMYRLAADAYESDGREIVNCTEGGHLELFPRGQLDEELKTATGPSRPRTRPGSSGRVLSGRRLLGDHDGLELMGQLEPGLVLDVGAAAGSVTSLLLTMNPQSRVIAYEPFPGNLPHFERAIGSDDRVRLRHVAVGDRPGRSSFFVSSTVRGGGEGLEALTGYSSHGYIVDAGDTADSRYFEVDVVTLDDEVDDHVRFCRIDVQGGERAVLLGATRLLESASIDVLFVEFDARDAEPLRLLDRHGYQLVDGQYLLMQTLAEPDPDDWETTGATVRLSTGTTTVKAWPRVPELPLDEYVAWVAAQRSQLGPLWCDMIAVSPGFVDRFEAAAAALRRYDDRARSGGTE